jgi:DNA-binding XRE family transcriptional regulator
MSSTSHAIEVQFDVPRDGGGKVICTASAGTSVIWVDRTQEARVPLGAQLLGDFLDEFQRDPEVAKHLPAVRREIAETESKAGAPMTLRSLRLARGMSQQDLARAVGTSQSSLSLLESRRQKPVEDTIRALAEALAVDFNTLMDALANG